MEIVTMDLEPTPVAAHIHEEPTATPIGLPKGQTCLPMEAKESVVRVPALVRAVQAAVESKLNNIVQE